MSFAPDSTSCRTKCAPRKPVPPVIRVVGGTFLTMAACFFVLFLGTICAVLFFGGVLGIFEYHPQITQISQSGILSKPSSARRALQRLPEAFVLFLILIGVICG